MYFSGSISHLHCNSTTTSIKITLILKILHHKSWRIDFGTQAIGEEKKEEVVADHVNCDGTALKNNHQKNLACTG